VGIQVLSARPLIRIHHHYSDKTVLLDVWQVTDWKGNAWGRESQELQWHTQPELLAKTFPAANYPILKALKLPTFYLITPEPEKPNDKHFFYQLDRILDRGEITLLQLRAKHFPDKALCECAERTLKVCEKYHARVLLNAAPELAISVGTDGVHLNSQLLSATSHRPLAKKLLVAASCHCGTEVTHANQIDCDFIVLSPLHRTKTHPEAVPLGWRNFFNLTELAKCPVFALGGMQPNELNQVFSHGGHGIAAIRALWQSVD
jgi:8-oxo-dGTP diphosphatase